MIKLFTELKRVADRRRGVCLTRGNVMNVIQKTGKFYSRIIMKNIGIFVFIGLLSVVFQTEGWFPNEDIYAISQVAYRYVLPCMIAYEGGNLLSDSFGGLAAVMALCGILLRDPEAGIFGAMVSAPLGGYLWKKNGNFWSGTVSQRPRCCSEICSWGLPGRFLRSGNIIFWQKQ